MPDEIQVPAPGTRIDFAPFGRIRYFYGSDPRKLRFVDAAVDGSAYLPSDPDDEGRRHIGVTWEDPRDVYSIAVTYAGAAPDPNDVQVQYWRKKWPFGFRDAGRGAGRGWIGRDDHYRGEWTTALSDVRIEGSRVVYDFHHLDITEIHDSHALEAAEDYNAEFRTALKFRLLFPAGAQPKVAKIEAFGGGEWKAGEVDIFGVGDASVKAYNGHITEVRHSGDALNVKYLYIPAPADDYPHRRTVITVRWQDNGVSGKSSRCAGSGEYSGEGFSFCASDVEESQVEAYPAGPRARTVPGRPIYIADYGILVRPAGDSRSPEEIVDQLVASGSPSIYDRVFEEPEQTFERAMREIPRLRAPFQHHPLGRYCPLGCEGSRQRFALRYNGSFFVDKRANKAMGRDTRDLLWPGAAMYYRFGSGDYPNWREHENACRQSWSDDGSPVITSTWIDRDVEYTQTAFAAYLREEMGEYFGKRGDEDIVLLVRFEVRNIAHDDRRAHLWLKWEPHECLEYSHSVLTANGRLARTEQLPSDELACRADRPDVPQSFNWIVRPYEKPLTRARIDLGKGCGYVQAYSDNREGPAGTPTAFHYETDLKGGERDVVTFVFPYPTLTSDEDIQLLGSIDYNAKLRDVRKFWTPFVNSGMRLSIPDKMIEDFFRFVPVHVAITATKDAGSGDYILPAATFGYGACGNEAIIQIRQLDSRGMHAQAEKYLDGLLRVQGANLLDGNFQTKEGALAGASFYDGKPLEAPFAYNTDHGFILWALSEHYFITRNREWLQRVAPNIIAGCDFVIRERQATKIEESGERVPEYGLLPAGHLEDNDEWRYWFAVNAHAYLGIKWAAESLAEIEHPDAERLAREAEDYRRDILAAMDRARIESPVVTLSDNTSIPHIPARTEIRGPEWGWFREGAYGALHLVDGHVLDPNDQRVTWVMKYLEGLVYPSRDFGRPIDLEKRWFSQAGVTIQANLLNNGVAYVRRDEPKHAVRAMFNDFAASIYDDVLIFTEHPVVQLSRGVGPYYKTPDECGFLNTLRACLVIEEDDTLFLAKAAPISWFAVGETVSVENAATWFGPVSYSITVGETCMKVTVKPPRRNPPAKLAIRLRRADGRPITAVTVNGQPAEFDGEREVLWLDRDMDEIVIVADS
jgi:hypothetical protein